MCSPSNPTVSHLAILETLFWGDCHFKYNTANKSSMYPGDVSPSFTRIVTHIAKTHKDTPTYGATLVHYQYCRWPHYSTQCSMLASTPADRHSTAWFQLAYIRTWSHHVCILGMTVHTDRFPVCTVCTFQRLSWNKMAGEQVQLSSHTQSITRTHSLCNSHSLECQFLLLAPGGQTRVPPALR